MKKIINKSNYSSRNYLMVSSELLIKTTSNFLWHSIIQDQQLLYFNPFIKSQSSGIINGVGHRDNCEYFSNISFERKVIEYVEGKRIKLNVKFKNKNHNAFAIFEIIESVIEKSATFKLSVETDAYKNIPRPIWYLLARFLLIPSFNKYVNGVVKGLEYYCETGKKVSPNQFGAHRQFSKR